MFASAFQVWGSGFQVLEQGASNLGTAAAGAVVNTSNDATAAYWNPSAAFFVESDNKLDVAVSIIAPEMKSHVNATHTSPYQPGTNINTPGWNDNAGKLAIVPNAFVVKKFSDKFAGTLSVTSPFGLATQYDEENNFVGRYDGVTSDIQAIQINPSLAYKVNDWLSVSVGASADYVHAELTSYTFIPQASGFPYGGFDARTKMDASGWSGSFNVGATAKFLETGRIGISYRYQIAHDVSGYATTSNPMFGVYNRQEIEASVTMPSNLNIGVSYKFKDDFWNQFTVMAGYSFTWWSKFKNLDIVNSSTGATISHTQENWRNTHRVSAGIAYEPDWNKDLTLRIGAAFDQSPIRNANFRTVRVPDTNRIWATCGLGYKIGNMNFDIAYMHIFFNNANIDNTQNHAYSSSTVKGYYTGCAHVVAMQMGVKW